MMVAVVTWHCAHDTPLLTGGVWESQYEMVPSNVAYAKLTLLLLRLVAVVPVGLPVPVAPAGGMTTVRPTMVPLASYKVERPVTWSDIHHSFSTTALLAARDMPHGLINFESCKLVTMSAIV